MAVCSGDNTLFYAITVHAVLFGGRGGAGPKLLLAVLITALANNIHTMNEKGHLQRVFPRILAPSFTPDSPWPLLNWCFLYTIPPPFFFQKRKPRALATHPPVLKTTGNGPLISLLPVESGYGTGSTRVLSSSYTKAWIKGSFLFRKWMVLGFCVRCLFSSSILSLIDVQMRIHRLQ